MDLFNTRLLISDYLLVNRELLSDKLTVIQVNYFSEVNLFNVA